MVTMQGKKKNTTTDLTRRALIARFFIARKIFYLLSGLIMISYSVFDIKNIVYYMTAYIPGIKEPIFEYEFNYRDVVYLILDIVFILIGFFLIKTYFKRLKNDIS